MEDGRIEGIKKGLFHFLKKWIYVKDVFHAFFRCSSLPCVDFESSVDAFNNYITYIFIPSLVIAATTVNFKHVRL